MILFGAFCRFPATTLLRRGITSHLSTNANFPTRRQGTYLNELALNRDPDGSILGILFDSKYTDPPNIIYLAGGLPSPFLFPFESATFKMKNNQIINIDEETMLKALQYGCIEGYGPLRNQLKLYVTKFHNVTDWKARNLVICAGATDALSRCLEMVLEKDVYVLAEEPLFGTIVNHIEAYESQYIGIEKDDLGMKPEALRKAVLSILEKKSKPKKLVLYANTLTVKRSSASKLTERMENIYKIAQEFDLLIIEVDPHFLLHISKENEKLSPSFLRLDSDERVLRCDSTSPLFGPALRVGCVTGPTSFMQLVCSHIDGSMLQASQLAQVLISLTIEESGDEELQNYSKDLHEDILVKRRDLEVVAKAFLGEVNWNLYPEYPYIWFKVEKTPELIKYLQDEASEIKFALTPYLLSSKKSHFTLGLTFEGASKEQMEKVCCKISEFLPRKGSKERLV